MSVDSSSLHESLREDQRRRWARGDRVLVESYLQQHPDLSRNAAVLVELIESEYLLRCELGETPSLDEYLDRFPALSGQLSQRLARLSSVDRAGLSQDIRRDSTLATGQSKLACPYCERAIDLLAGSMAQCAHCGRAQLG